MDFYTLGCNLSVWLSLNLSVDNLQCCSPLDPSWGVILYLHQPSIVVVPPNSSMTHVVVYGGSHL